MNTKLILSGAAAALFTLHIAAPAISASSGGSMMTDTTPSKRSFCGVVIRIKPEDKCIGVKSGLIGMQVLYDITGAAPQPRVGERIEGTGTTGGTSTCMAGTHLTDVMWKAAHACPLTK